MIVFFQYILLLILVNIVHNINGFHVNLNIFKKISLTSLNLKESNDKSTSVIDERYSLSKNIIASSDTSSVNQNEENENDLDLFSATNLVTGTTVGAGIIALPTYCRPDGFIPS